MYENSFLNPAYITPEEQQILDGDIAVQKNLYTSKQDFVVESDKFLEHSEDDITQPSSHRLSVSDKDRSGDPHTDRR